VNSHYLEVKNHIANITMGSEDFQIIDKQYGKNYVRLLHVKREGRRHQIRELEVNTKLTLNDVRDFTQGDNAKIIATDTQKNTVYILAKQYGVSSIEEFASLLASHFLKTYSWVVRARIYIEEKPWSRITMDGRQHNHAFVEGGLGTFFCSVEQNRNEEPKISSGLKDLKVMKTTQSAFVGFHRDAYRSLPDMDDRVFCTIVYCKWDYSSTRGLDFTRAREQVRQAVLDEFAGPADVGIFSPSVQKTIYDTQKRAMTFVPQISKMYIELPNVHAYEYDFSKFPALGLKNEGEVFQPTDKPSGNIQATVQRKVTSRL
jgi:urate oxidase